MRTIVSVGIALCALVGSASAAGSVDGSFSGDGRLLINAQGRFTYGIASEATSVVTLADHRLVVGGTVWFERVREGHTYTRPVIAKVNRDGTLDQSFGSSGLALPYIPGWDDADVDQISVWSDGRIVVSGTADGRMYVMRLTASGALDTSFAGTGYRVLPLSVDEDDTSVLHALVPYGKVVVAGVTGTSIERIALTRIDWNGNLDASFSGTGSATRYHQSADWTVTGYSVKSMIYTSRGEIALGASIHNSGGPTFVVFRFGYAGALVQELDPRWDLQRDYYLWLGDIAEDLQGRLVATGSARLVDGGPDRIFVARFEHFPAYDHYSWDGLYTPTEPFAFTAHGATLFSFPDVYHAYGEAVTTLGDKIVVGGYTNTGHWGLAQFQASGAFDPDFSGDGRVQVKVTTAPDEIYDVAITLDNLVVAAGKGGNYMAVVRLR